MTKKRDSKVAKGVLDKVWAEMDEIVAARIALKTVTGADDIAAALIERHPRMSQAAALTLAEQYMEAGAERERQMNSDPDVAAEHAEEIRQYCLEKYGVDLAAKID